MTRGAMRRRTRPVAVAGLVWLAAWLSAGPRAEKLLYAVEIPDRQAVTYELELPVAHPGRLAVHAVWSGKRMLALRLDPPDKSASFRRSGSSPLHLEAEVTPELLGEGPWKLSIYALPFRGDGKGTLTVELPEPHKLQVEPKRAAQPAAPAPPLDPWLRPRQEPPGGSAEEIRMYRAVERLRTLVAAPDAPLDACRWQSPLMRFLADQRDGVIPPADASTRTLLERLADAIARVEELRVSRDPILTGPPPEDPGLYAAWLRARSERIQDLESELDELLTAVEDGFAPELESSRWPGRMASCLTACERHFEERTRVGEERAINRELTVAQWQRLLAAEQALRGVLEFRGLPAVVTPRFRVR